MTRHLQAVFILMALVFYTGAEAASPARDRAKKCAQTLRLSEVSTAEVQGPKIELEADYAGAVAEQSRAEQATLQKMQDSLPNLYEELQRHAKREMTRGAKDFSYSILTPVLERIRIDLELRKGRRFGAEFAVEIEKVRQKAARLLVRETPYFATVRFLFNDYLPLIDRIFGKRHPELMANEYHRGHAGHLLDKFLSHKPGQPPEMLLYFSFESVDAEFFLKSRTAPLFLVGLYIAGLDDDMDHVPFADGFKMKPSEFSWHDMGHIDFMWLLRDLQYLRSTSKSLDRVIREWEATRLRYMKFLEPFKSDRLLYHAMVLLMVEMVHERGFQYSFSVLKKELETPKWVEILRRKLGNGYYRVFPQIYTDCFARMDEALNLLHQFTRQEKIDAQKNWMRALQAEVVPARFIYNAPLRYGVAAAQSVEIKGDRPQDFVVHLNHGELNMQKTDILHVLLPQVDPAQTHPLNEAKIRKIQQLLTLRSKKTPVLVIGGVSRVVSSVVVLMNKTIEVKFTDGSTANLDQVKVDEATTQKSLDNLRLFEITQILGSVERGTPLTYTVEEAPVVMKGVGQLRVDENGRSRVTVRYHLTGRILGDYDLADLRIDSLDLVE